MRVAIVMAAFAMERNTIRARLPLSRPRAAMGSLR
jgi:hypothetical protein